MIKNPLFALIIITLVGLASCEIVSSKNNNHSYPIFEVVETSNKPDYQQVDEIKKQLLINGIDTIVYYKRTSIGCCDFYYLLWEKDSKVFLHKFFYDQERECRRSVRIEINDDAIFDIIQTKLIDLKTNKIKDNSHILKKEGDVVTIIPSVMSSHYRYSEINIYSQNDSIFSGRIKDTDFNKLTGVENDKGDPFKNDHYEENISSSWNLLLTAIENKVLTLNITGQREKEIARIFINELNTTNSQ